MCKCSGTVDEYYCKHCDTYQPNDRPSPHEQAVAAKVAQPHKHAATIKAWADGAEIQYRCRAGNSGTWSAWMDTRPNSGPSWNTSNEYRVKPTPVPLWEIAKKAWYFSECCASFDEVTTKSRWQTVAEAIVKAYEERGRVA